MAYNIRQFKIQSETAVGHHRVNSQIHLRTEIIIKQEIQYTDTYEIVLKIPNVDPGNLKVLKYTNISIIVF